MTPIILAVILLGLQARTNARPWWPHDELPREDEDSYFEAKYGFTLAEALSSTCSSTPGIPGRAIRRVSSVEFLLDRVICPALENLAGSGEGSGEGSGDGLGVASGDNADEYSDRWIYNFEAIEMFTPDVGVQIALSKIAEGICQEGEEVGFDNVDLEKFCRFSRVPFDTDDEESGSGEISSGSGDDDDDDNDDGFSIHWSSYYEGLENDAFYF